MDNIAFDWDKYNLYKNKLKHNVDYWECEEVFSNERIVIIVDVKHSLFEKRYKALGYTNNNRKLMIIFTKRNMKIRVISARDQNKNERFEFYNATI